MGGGGLSSSSIDAATKFYFRKQGNFASQVISKYICAENKTRKILRKYFFAVQPHLNKATVTTTQPLLLHSHYKREKILALALIFSPIGCCSRKLLLVCIKLNISEPVVSVAHVIFRDVMSRTRKSKAGCYGTAWFIASLIY